MSKLCERDRMWGSMMCCVEAFIECVGAGWNVWERDGMCGNGMECLGAGWNVCERDRMWGNVMCSVEAFMEFSLERDGVCWSKMVCVSGREMKHSTWE